MLKKLFLQSTAFVFLLLVCGGCYHVWKPLPEGLDYQSQLLPGDHVRFLKDMTYITPAEKRQSDQEIFDSLFGMINHAEKLIVVDMFLFNTFTGDNGPPYRNLCHELTSALINREKAVPDIRIIVITDPVNTVYGGLEAKHLTRLKDAGVEVIITDLNRLRDSNPLYSSPWRLFVKPFGNAANKGTVANPFGGEKVTLRSWLKLINFKANHRKVAVMDSGAPPPAGNPLNETIRSRPQPYQLRAWVSSANPHDGSSAHDNVALIFDGPAARDILKTEEAVIAYTSPKTPLPSQTCPLVSVSQPSKASKIQLQILTEGAIGQMADQMIEQSQPGDKLDLVMFYLADRKIITRLKKAAARGVTMRVILDPSKDAFGRIKKGLPNRQTGDELVKAGVALRWADTHGEQSHTKLLIIHHPGGASDLLIGSANFTRRNVRNDNLETNVLLAGPTPSLPIADATAYVNQLWTNADGKHFTTDFETYRDDSIWKKFKYRIQEKTGMCTW